LGEEIGKFPGHLGEEDAALAPLRDVFEESGAKVLIPTAERAAGSPETSAETGHNEGYNSRCGTDRFGSR
jgi:hypothetical protein